MPVIDAIQNQSFFDLAIQQFGTADAISTLLDTNPTIGTTPYTDLDLAKPLVMDTPIVCDADDTVIDNRILKLLNGRLIATITPQTQLT